MIIRLVSHLLIVTMFSSSCGLSAFAAEEQTADSMSASAEESASTDGELAPGFMIQLTSSQDSSLNGSFRIQIDGKIELPYNVTLQTRGMDLKQLQAELAKVYRPYFTSTPKVKATIKQRRYYVDVRGFVAHPGVFLIKHETPLDEVIALAGGITENITQGYARIEQNGQTRWVNLADYFKRGKQKDVPEWVGGDRIFFQKEGPEGGTASEQAEFQQKVQVMGEVRTPGELTYRRDADAYYYMIKTGGPTQAADLDQVEVIRPTGKDGARQPISLGPVQDIKVVKEGDILLFRPQRQSTGEKVLQQTAMVAGIMSAIVLAVIAIKGLSK